MDCKINTLYLFTVKFPYGPTAETFIETEIKYLADKFKQVVIVPSAQKETEMRPLPDNVRVLSSLKEYSNTILPFLLIMYLPKMLGIVLYEAKHSKRSNVYITHPLLYFKMLFKNIVKYHILKKEFERSGRNVICYDYWFVDSTIALALLKKEDRIKHFISRSHRFDLYDDTSFPTPPFANFILKYVDNIFTVSKDGERALKSKLDGRFNDKIKTFYLGTPIPQSTPVKDDAEVFTIMSCSELVSVKRVNIIVEALSQIKTDKPVHWIHIGDGYLMDSVRQQASELPANIKCSILGHQSNRDVLEFYKQTYIDMFINVSNSEGLPVSIMEAISHGIPVIACDICGIPEIVNEKTGFLIDVNEEISIIAELIDIIADGEMIFNRLVIANFCKDTFDADKNHIKFVDNLTNLE